MITIPHMSQRRITLRGWQSWTHCKHGPTLIKRIRNHSPFPYDDVVITIPEDKKSKSPITGWCSWNSFMLQVSEQGILTVVDWLVKRKKDIPVEYILIDDGWCEWGDWVTPKRKTFPDGIHGTAKKIREKGFKTGLWLAPFLASEHSNLVKEKPEWFCRKRFGRWVEGRKNYRLDRLVPGRKYLLDFENPEVFEYILQSIRKIVQEWGITLLKLDFLYAGHFNPKYRTGEQADAKLQELLRAIKAMSPELQIIACGCPLAPAVGLVDAMRISDDVILPPLKRVPVINWLVHSIRLRQLQDNFQARKETNVLWNIDPDMFVCHPSYGLSHLQRKKFQAVIKQANGVMMLGDYLPELSEEEIATYLIPLFR